MPQKRTRHSVAKPSSGSTPQRASSGSGTFQLHPEHCEKIALLKPELLRAVHEVLKKNGVNATVHTISFRPADAVAMSGGPCGSQPCCYINGVWTCPG
jgi:hypothetical protein